MKTALTLWCLLVFCAAHSLAAQTPAPAESNLPALLARMQDNIKRNHKLGMQYTSDELWHNRNYDKKGKLTLDKSAKYENVFIEGLPYRRKVEEDGKPLTGKAAAEEQKRYEKAVAERKAMTLSQKRHIFSRTYSFSLPTCCLTTLFDNRVLRHEQLNGRDTLVVESVPRPGVAPKSADDKSSLDWKQTTWIDTADEMLAQFEAELLQDKNHVAKGMKLTVGFIRLLEPPAPGDGSQQPVWLQQRSLGQFNINLLWMSGSGATEQTWSNFKRFHVDMRLIEDSVQELPATPPQ